MRAAQRVGPDREQSEWKELGPGTVGGEDTRAGSVHQAESDRQRSRAVAAILEAAEPAGWSVAMELEHYFDFVGEDAIRIAGTRIGIETVVRDYREGASPEEIVLRYPTLSLEQVHATITYYLGHQSEIEAYLERVWGRGHQAWKEQQARPSPFVRSLRERLHRQRQQSDKTLDPETIATSR
jgi:uncharacterized protein (DUF433 family)